MAHEAEPGDSAPDLWVDPETGPLAARLVALVALGGALGTASRYELGRWLPTSTSGFPRGTFLANLLGTVILGLLLESLARAGRDTGGRRQLRLLIGTGFCGGLTTYSTFAVESALLARGHHDGLAATYAITTVLAGLVVAGLAIAVAARFHAHRAGRRRA